MKNLAHQFAIKKYGSVFHAKAEYIGLCIDFVGDCISHFGKGRLAYFDDPPKRYHWKWHACYELNGWIHDLWEDRPMPLAEYMELIGAVSVEYPAEELISD